MQEPQEQSIVFSSDKFFTGVLKNDLPYILPYVEGLLKEAIKTMNGRMDYNDLLTNLRTGQEQLWIAGQNGKIEACLITEIVVYYKKKMCALRICTGQNRYHWQNYMNIVEEWAKANGCDGMEAIARKGWARILDKMGWSQSHIFIEKDFKNGCVIKTGNTNHINGSLG